MAGIHLRPRVARRALKYFVVRGIRVTGRTDSPRISVTRREPGVVEGRPGPNCRGMTRFTGRGVP